MAAREAAAAAGVMAALLVAGCGGGSTAKTPSSSESSSTTASQTTASGRVKQTVRVFGVAGGTAAADTGTAIAGTGTVISTTTRTGSAAGTGTASASARGGRTVKALPGQQVLLRTSILAGKSSGPQEVRINGDTGPSNTLRITAVSAGHRSEAKITSANGSPVTLAEVRYTCALPPAPTVCPAHSVASKGHGFKLSFSASSRTAIALSAVVGPVAVKTGPPGQGALPTSAYQPTERVQVHTSAPASAGTTTPAVIGTPALTPGPAVTVSPGDRVAMITELSGQSGGLAQQTTITIPKGPAKTLTVSAAVPASHTSRATITAAGSGRITLGPPVFACAVPPAPTFCAPTQIKDQAHAYKVTFSAAPRTPPILFQASVRRG
jgi:hypothetical protein